MRLYLRGGLHILFCFPEYMKIPAVPRGSFAKAQDDSALSGVKGNWKRSEESHEFRRNSKNII
jgi:hypothetical protein